MEEKLYDGYELAADRPGFQVKHTRYKNVTMTISRPILSEAESAKVCRQITNTLEGVMPAYLARKKEKEQNMLDKKSDG